MKLSVIQENLARGLAVVGHGVASRNTLPILSNVYLGTEDGGLRLVATNLEIAVTHWVPAKIEEKGATTIPARLLSDVVNGLPNEKIDISLLPDGRVHLKCGRSASHLRATPADDFPQVGAAGERVTARISQKELRAALDSTVFAAAGDEARPILTGVLTSFTGEKATFAAADNYRIAVAGAALAEAAPETSIIVPARAYAELLRLLSDVDDLVEITLTPAKNQLQFKLGDTMLVSRLIDGQFPPFQQ
jgi:DNA polymerase-3 subunit beta